MTKAMSKVDDQELMHLIAEFKAAMPGITEAEARQIALAEMRSRRAQAKINQIRSRAKTRERQKRERTLILLGVVVEQMLKTRELDIEQVRAKINKHLTNERSRNDALRGLSEIGKH